MVDSSYCKDIRMHWKETFEADVAYHYRYAIDKLTSLPEYNLRKIYWDMEWQQGGTHDSAVTCISYYDSYQRAYNVLWWSPLGAVPDVTGHCKPNESEHDMLESFVRIIEDYDPDMLIAWFGSKFDLPKLIQRLNANNIEEHYLLWL